MSPTKVEQYLRLAPAVVSLESPVGNDGVTLGDILDRPVRAEEHIEVHGLFVEDLDDLMGRLREREADVLRRRFALPPYDEEQTLDEIGKEYKVTRERIRQIESRALDNLVDLVRERGIEVPDRKPRRSRRQVEGAGMAS